MEKSEASIRFFARRQKVLTWFLERFPQAFGIPLKPLKVVIFEDILNSGSEGMPAKKWLNFALNYHVGSSSNLKSLKAGIQRVDLNGLCQGEVTVEQEKLARSILDTRSKAFKQRKKQNSIKNIGEKAAEISEETPDLTLSDKNMAKPLLTLKKNQR